MRTTTYRCDKCGKEVKGRWEMKIVYSAYFSLPENFDLCDKCYKQLKKWLKSQEVK